MKQKNVFIYHTCFVKLSFVDISGKVQQFNRKLEFKGYKIVVGSETLEIYFKFISSNSNDAAEKAKIKCHLTLDSNRYT